jgi:HNH endonuclease
MNFADINKEVLDDCHYVLRSPGHPRRWAAFSPAKVNRSRERWGDDFCLLVVGDLSAQDDFYAIPWPHISHLFIEENVYPLQRKGKVTPQWKMHLEGPPHVFQLEFAKNDFRPGPRFDASAWYGNRHALLGESALDRLDVTAEAAEAAGDFDVSNPADARRRVAAAIVRRQGQPAFRKRLLDIYGGACAFSGCRVPHVLDAAHILPYRGPATNHPQNGLLLRTDLHTLFDLGLLVVDSVNMTIVTAPSLEGTEYAQLSGKKIAVPSDPSLVPSAAALNEHRRSSKPTQPTAAADQFRSRAAPGSGGED